MATKSGDNGKPFAGASTAARKDDACECRSGPIFGSALINGANFTGKWLHYSEVEGNAMFEGDIVLGSIGDLQSDEAGNPVLFSIGLSGQQFRWPNGRVPFEIDPALPNQQRVNDAIAHWHANTGIRFVARTAADVDLVRFVPGGGCSSMVGKRGGTQNITLGPNCTTGNAIHEIGHAVGLWHEQSREDRDNFVQVVFANIDPAMQHNFNQHVSDGDDLGGYDLGSCMHYPATAFSINGQATIVPRQPLPPGVVMGQRNGLSPGDIAGVLAMYPRPQPTAKEVAKDPIRDTIKEVRKDPIRDTIKEVAKDPVRDTIKEVRKDPIRDTIKEVAKDPVRDTIKEVRKDPITDRTTMKEAAFDPIGPIGPGLPFSSGFDTGSGASATPFVLAGQSQFMHADPIAAATAQLQQLAEAYAATEQQLETLAAAYSEVEQALTDLQGGGGGV